MQQFCGNADFKDAFVGVGRREISKELITCLSHIFQDEIVNDRVS